MKGLDVTLQSIILQHLSMKENQKLYSQFQLVSAVFMIVALLWLTISAPFVYAGQQEIAKQDNVANNGSPLAGTEEEANPFGEHDRRKSSHQWQFPFRRVPA